MIGDGKRVNMQEGCVGTRSLARNFDSDLIAFRFFFLRAEEKKSFDLFGSGRQLWLVLIDIKCGGAAKKSPIEV
jgi:hypothetical protein